MSSQKRRNFLKTTLLSSLGLGLLRGGNASTLSLPPLSSELTDWKRVRKQFPLRSNKMYLNTASLGPSPQMVIDTITDTIQGLEVNCYTGRKDSYDTHAKLGQFLNVAPETLAVTRNATEGMNIAARSLKLNPGDEIIITDQEHVGGAAPWIALKQQLGVQVKLVRIDLSGENNLERIAEAIGPKTKVVAFSHVTCTTGLILPAKEIVSFCRDKGIYTCIDGAQAIGMIGIDLKEINPDFYTASGHKWLFGPKGTGVLYINPELMEDLEPTFVGAYSDYAFDLETLEQEYRMVAHREEYGTRNTGITLGLGAAVDFVQQMGMQAIEARGRDLSQALRSQLESIPEVEILTPSSPEYSASILTFKVKDIPYLDVQKHLGIHQKLYVRGIYEANLNALRVSCAVFNQPAELDLLVEGITEIVKK